MDAPSGESDFRSRDHGRRFHRRWGTDGPAVLGFLRWAGTLKSALLLQVARISREANARLSEQSGGDRRDAALARFSGKKCGNGDNTDRNERCQEVTLCFIRRRGCDDCSGSILLKLGQSSQIYGPRASRLAALARTTFRRSQAKRANS